MLPQEEKQVIHDYSDSLTEAVCNIPCYSIVEMISEKLRALIQRSYSAPRDYYDIWMLSRTFTDLDYDVIVSIFHKKMKFKGLQFVGIEEFINEKTDKIVSAAWNNSLARQIPNGNLPCYEKVKEELLTLFEKMFRDKK
jgi:predicted nucleotidyltransferase component of viral defense system